jgi:hypothetical protein
MKRSSPGGASWPALSLMASLFAAAPAYAQGDNCADSLIMTAPSKLKRALSAELAASGLRERRSEPCRGVRVDLRRSGDGAGDLIVTLYASNGMISRRVSSVVDAAFWVESWLEPDLDEPPVLQPHPDPPHAGDVPSHAAQPLPNTPVIVLPSPPSAGPRSVGPRATIGLVGRTSLDADGASWNGMELFADVEVAPPLWLGAGLGRSWDYVFGRSALGASIERVTTHAIVRVGGAWDVARDAEWSIGLGAGVMLAFVRGAPLAGGGVATDDEGVGVVEFASGLRYTPTPRLGFRFGLELERSVELERSDPREPGEPVSRVEPAWRGGLVVGIGLSFGKE